MPKLSPAYREDTYEELPLDLRTYLDEHFLRQLPNVDVTNPKLLVVFSGSNAVGKSSLSHKIQNELDGVVLENDAIKLQLLKFNPQMSREELQLLTWKYTMDIYQRAATSIPNGLIIRDGVIDWYYDRVLPIFEKQGYEFFIVGYQLSREKLIQLINARGDKPTVSAERLISLLEDHAIHQRRFRQAYKPDILLTDETVFDHDRVVELIRTRIETAKRRSV
jgi:predicted kinase